MCNYDSFQFSDITNPYTVETQPSKYGRMLVAAENYVRCKNGILPYHVDG